MKPSFHHRLLNSYFEDPCLYVRILREKRAIQFDIGDVRVLSTAELHKITDVFVTHTHIDHFIGFDMLLRVILSRETPLNVYGPPNITSCVEGKLRGYTWNLIEDYPAVVNVFSYDGRHVTASVFRARDRFRKERVGRTVSDGILLREPQFKVKATKLDHDTTCLAYAMEEEFHINIDKDRLNRMGLPVGPWLTEFKRLLREKVPKDSVLTVEGKPYSLAVLKGIAGITKGQKITYATDIAMTRANAEKLVELARDSDMFYCEAYFLEKDIELALQRFHLTAKACGSIARRAGAKKLSVVHLSPRYAEHPGDVVREAMEEFNKMVPGAI
jgi:ribonuclease Z